MKILGIAAIAALLSFPAIAQEGHTPDQICAELGDVMYAAALGASDVRVNYGDFHDARTTAQALAADQLDILLNAESYSVVSEMVDALVVEMYRMPQSEFHGGTHSDVPWQMADRAKSIYQSNCLRDFSQG